MKYLILLILFTSVIFPSSFNMQYLEVPAVSDSNTGMMINISIRQIDGRGQTYVSTAPLAGEEFQQSVNNVMEYIHSRYAVQNTNFLVSSDASGIASVLDGPSAGIAIGIIAKSLAEGKQISHDISVTGGMDSNGNVLPVGALAEKAEISSKNGKAAFLVKPVTIDDRVELDKLSSTLNFPIIEFDDFNSAYSIFTTSNAEYKTTLSYPVQSVDIMHLERRVPDGMFYLSVQQLLEDLELELPELKHGHPSAYKYIKSKYELAKSLHERGYTYSAGNEAFLALYKARLLNSNLSDDDIILLLDSVNDCINDMKPKVMDSSSIPAYLNSELRLYWADDEAIKFNGMNISALSLSQKIKAVQQLNRAYEWCRLSNQLINTSDRTLPFGVNKSFVKEYDEKLLFHYMSGIELTDHLNRAMRAYKEGYYGASLMEIMYHESIVNATYDVYAKDYSAKSDWSKMMLAHSNYLSLGDEYGADSSMQVRRMAYFYDLHMSDLRGEPNYILMRPVLHPLDQPVHVYAFGGQETKEHSSNSEFVLLILIAILIPVAALLHSLWRRSAWTRKIK